MELVYPHKKGIINIIEGIQRRATKLIPKIKYMSYEDRLKFLKLPTLCYRRLRGNMIETSKILNNKCDSKIPNLLLNNSDRTRGNKYKLKITRAKHELRKYSFCLCVPEIWN